MKKWSFLPLLAIFFLFLSCGSSGDSSSETKPEETTVKSDDGKGIGEITSVKLNDPLDAAMVEKGKSIYDLKCSACHKLTNQRVVGPGWSGITEKRKPEWIMNMVMNVEVMLAEDPAAQKLLEECLIRMPNQNLSQEDARNVLEFMYANDESQVAD